jgi:hypothetical protein
MESHVCLNSLIFLIKVHFYLRLRLTVLVTFLSVDAFQVNKCGGIVASCWVAIELSGLKGRDRVGARVDSLLQK